MRTNHKLTLAVLVGIVIGVAGATAIHARQVKAPPAYIVAEVDVQDPATFQKYAEKAPGTIALFNVFVAARRSQWRANRQSASW